MPTPTRLVLPGASRPAARPVRAGVPKPPPPPPPKPQPPEPRPAARAKAEPAPRSPERIATDIATDREAAAKHHPAMLDEPTRAAAERVLAGGAVRVSRRQSSERHLVR